MSYLQSYLDRIRGKGNPALADAIHKTVEDIVPQYISNFSFTDHVVSLLVGDVQSGKTSHMFGLMCAAADESFMNPDYAMKFEKAMIIRSLEKPLVTRAHFYTG